MTTQTAGRATASGWIVFPLYVLLLATTLTLCDYFSHVRLGVLFYMHPEHTAFFPGQPTGDVFFGFLQLAVGCLALGWACFRDEVSPGLPRALFSIVLFVALYFASGLFKDAPMTLYVAFMATWALQLFLFGDAVRRRVLFSVALGVIGPVWEGYGSSHGFFTYHDQAVYFVPAWLSPMYLNGALAVAASIPVLASWVRPRVLPAAG